MVGVVINESILGNWVAKYRQDHPVAEVPLSGSERAAWSDDKKRLRELEMENAFLKRSAAFFAKEHP